MVRARCAAHPIRLGAQPHPLGVSGELPAVSGDGNKLAFVHDHEIRLLPLTPEGLAGGAATKVVEEPSRISTLAWTPDSRDIIYVLLDDRSRVRCVAARPGAAPRIVARVDGELVSLSASPGGELLGTAIASRNSLWTLDLGVPGVRPALRQDLPWNTGTASVSPDGRKLAYSVAEDAGSAVYLGSLDGTNPRRLFGLGYRIQQLRWSPDGTEIAVIAEQGQEQLAPSRLFVASAAEGSPHQLLEKLDSVYAAAWSSDGRALFIVASKDGVDSIWSVKLADRSLTPISNASALELYPSQDDNFLYLLQRPFNLTRLSLAHPEEEHLASGVLRFEVGEGALYLVRQDSKPPDAKGLNLYRLALAAPGTPEFTAHIGFLPSSMRLSPDARVIYMERHEPPQERIVEVQRWRDSPRRTER